MGFYVNEGECEKVEIVSVDCFFNNCGYEEREELGGRKRKMLCLRWERFVLLSFLGKVKGKKLLILCIIKFIIR